MLRSLKQPLRALNLAALQAHMQKLTLRTSGWCVLGCAKAATSRHGTAYESKRSQYLQRQSAPGYNNDPGHQPLQAQAESGYILTG